MDEIINMGNVNQFKTISDQYSVYREILDKFIESLNEAFKLSGFKYGNVELDEVIPGKANIRFCSDRYHLKLLFDLSNKETASIVLYKEVESENGEMNKSEIGKVAIDDLGNIAFQGFRQLSKNDKDIHNAFVILFLGSIKKA